MYSLIRKILFRVDAEMAHHLTVNLLKIVQQVPEVRRNLERFFQVQDPRLTTHCMGLTFPNPVGMAAGFDKHAEIYPALAALGFGYIEVGTLTPRPQSGNPRPRIFRLPVDQAVINRMGFNNKGAEAAKQSFIRLPRPRVPIGINLGKNKTTPNDQAAEDYLLGLETLYPYGDYFVINISSPNTAGLRDLQEVEFLRDLLERIIMKRNQQAVENGSKHPILVKIAPDLTDEQLSDIIATAKLVGIDGIIATNTTIERSHLQSMHREQTGGLSGRPLTQRSLSFIRTLYQELKGTIPIIGVGGIFTGRDAFDKITAGATLIQVYTGMIYQGPAIVKQINRELIQILNQSGLSSIEEAIGNAHSASL
ncbi:dihydroorotate oxidase A [Seinonella peptonophila]|uniref:Dihydroorotate dehydrogenase (quinone) n=1 Tax=Seinonella peptonophila TaxID=112248 RepID=A0A1M4XNG1_9BACL|nr:quinone-dependent dihydroorotate dehydrogenase [Seinonella peptonophila]SHE95127.1 dihydroorotate oxidase A [Seinonella peptonophila]